MRVTVHIGFNKAGSSSIQAYCFKKAGVLKQTGLYYPLIGTHDNAHYGISKFFMGLPVSDNVAAGPDLMTNISEAISSSGCDNVLISSEYFVLASPQHIQRVRDVLFNEIGATEVAIIAYLRRHDLWFESLFNQAVRTSDSPQWDLDIKDYVIHALGGFGLQCRYHTVLDRWARVFGNESIIVRPFEKGQFAGGELITDFFAHVFPQHEVDVELANVRNNVSVSPQRLYMVGLLRRWPESPERERAIGAILAAPEPVEGVFPSNFVSLADAQRRSLIRFFETEYAAIARRFLKRPDGRLFLEEK